LELDYLILQLAEEQVQQYLEQVAQVVLEAEAEAITLEQVLQAAQAMLEHIHQ
jgi:hypothetical protein